MTYSKHVDKYPEEFKLLLTQAATAQVEIPCASPKEAKRLQGRLYAFLGAVSAAAKEEPTEENRELEKFCRKTQMRLQGATLIVRPLDMDEDAQLLRGILGTSLQKGLPGTSSEDLPKAAPPGQVLVPMNPEHLPPWLAALAITRAGEN